MNANPQIHSINLKYLQCKKGSSHDGQVLNYICIQKSCQEKGLICSVCKNDHHNHQVLPLTYMLNMLKDYQFNQISTQSFQSQIQALQMIRNLFLNELKIITEKLSHKIQIIQETILETFEKKKVELLNRIEINRKFNQMIEETLSRKLSEQERVERDFRKIASLVHNSNQKEGKTIYNFTIEGNLKEILTDYEKNLNSFSCKAKEFLESSQMTLSQILQVRDSGSSIIVNQSTKIATKSEYSFSLTYKPPNIEVLNDNLTADCKNGCPDRFALIDGPVHKQGSLIRFKIDSMKSWVGLGIALKDKIINRGYKFAYNIGHFSYLMSSNGYSWSFTNASQNMQLTPFSFLTGDVIKVEVHPQQLIFVNETRHNNTFKLHTSLTKDQWQDVCFCVNLTSTGDKVSILY